MPVNWHIYFLHLTETYLTMHQPLVIIYSIFKSQTDVKWWKILLRFSELNQRFYQTATEIIIIIIMPIRWKIGVSRIKNMFVQKCYKKRLRYRRLLLYIFGAYYYLLKIIYNKYRKLYFIISTVRVVLIIICI